MATHPELLNPPPDVQEAVAGVIKACGMWEPTSGGEPAAASSRGRPDHARTIRGTDLWLHPASGCVGLERREHRPDDRDALRCVRMGVSLASAAGSALVRDAAPVGCGMSARTSKANGKAATTKPPRPVEALIRGETLDERLTMIAIQVDHVMRVTEAMAGLLMCVGYALRDEALLGSFPGDTYSNVRRPPIHTKTASDLMPLSGVWTGEAEAPCPMYPPGSPALLCARVPAQASSAPRSRVPPGYVSSDAGIDPGRSRRRGDGSNRRAAGSVRGAPMTAVCVPLPCRLATCAVTAVSDLVLGWIRLDVPAQEWIARSRGSERSAACLRKFADKPAAVAWLQERDPAPAEPGRSPYAVPGQRRSA